MKYDRRERHVEWLERMLDDALRENEQLRDFHHKLKEVSNECKEITSKYLNLRKDYEDLDKEYYDMLQLIYIDNDEVLN